MLINHYLEKLDHLLSIPDLEELNISKSGEIWIEQAGQEMQCIKHTELDFKFWHLMTAAISNKAGLFFCPHLSPTVSSHLPGRHRYEATISKTAVLEGLSVSIRMYRKLSYPLSAWGVTNTQKEQIKEIIFSGQSMAISGGTSSGKTNFLKSLLDLIPKKTRIFSVEDTLEIDLSDFSPSVQFLTKRGSEYIDAQGFAFKDAARTLLRSNPTLVIVGELSPENTIPILNMLNAGVQLLFTGHANSPDMLFEKFEQNAALVGKNIIATENLKQSLGGIVQLQCITKEGYPRKRIITDIWTQKEKVHEI